MRGTKNSGLSPSDICREHGWTVGTRLVGDEGYGPTIIRITAIGESAILARMERHNGEEALLGEPELSWNLDSRDWTEVLEGK